MLFRAAISLVLMAVLWPLAAIGQTCTVKTENQLLAEFSCSGPGCINEQAMRDLVCSISSIGGGGGGGAAGNPAAPSGSLQYNNGGVFGGYAIGSSFSTTGGVFDLGAGKVSALALAPGAAAFNLGGAAGDISGTWPNLSLTVGSASRSVGNLGICLGGTLPNPTSLAASCVLGALGAPSGDLGGATYSAPIVTGLQGFPICSGIPPPLNSALTWGGSCYTPVVQAPGINQLSGDALAGPGTGLQTITIQPQAVNNIKLALMAPLSVKANPSTSIGGAAPQDIPVTGGLTLSNGGLQLGTLGPSQQYTVTAGDCLTINNGIITGVVPGTACATGGDTLVADDGSTVLDADDGVTALLVDGAPPPGTACGSWQTDFSVTTGCNLPFLLFLKI